MPAKLTEDNHDRHIAGLKYIYPVISRRAGGLSIGINFNPNNACNWRCIYCQVPGLQFGNAPDMDFDLLAKEFRQFLTYVQNGVFFRQFSVEANQQTIKDIAISGNGEPTSLKNFSLAVVMLGDIANEYGIFPAAKFVLISNGSLIHKTAVQAGLTALARYQGELWFKLDSATEQGRKLMNNTGQSQKKLLENLKIAGNLCTTKLQTCMLHYQNKTWSGSEKQAYLQLLTDLKEQSISVHGIMLYSIARQSFQPEAENLEIAEIDEMNAFAADIKAIGYDVSVNH